MGCVCRPSHSRHYLKTVSVAITLDNTMTYSYFHYIIHSTTLQQSTLTPTLVYTGAWGGVVVKALRYDSDGPGIDSRWCHWEFFSVAPPDANMCPGVDSESKYQGFLLG